MANISVYAPRNSRFEYLLSDLTRRPGVEFHNKFACPKVMLLESGTVQLWVECHDGVRDSAPLERTDRPKIVIEHRNKNKRQVYVKPNFSESQSTLITRLLEEENVELYRCHPWSYYPAYQFHRDRNSYISSLIEIDDCAVFAGNIEQNSDRKRFIRSVSNSIDIKVIGNLDPARMLSRISRALYCVQPDGVGPRHNIYEAMMIGVPSIIQENSYVHPDVRSCSIVTTDGRDVPELDELRARRSDLSRSCLEVWHSKFTPHNINNEILSHL